MNLMNDKNFFHLPVILMLAIYLPASLLGLFVFRDIYAIEILILLTTFLIVYYGLYKYFEKLLDNHKIRKILLQLGGSINWRLISWLCLLVYLTVLVVAALTVVETPIEAALRGADWLDIATARANLFVNRQGPDALLRYLYVILGRTVMPLIVTYLFWTKSGSRYWVLLGLLCCYGVSLEKASSLFAFLPIILISVSRREWANSIKYLAICMACISIWTFLSMGGLNRNANQYQSVAENTETTNGKIEIKGFGIGRRGDPQRHYFFNFINSIGVPFDTVTDPTGAKGKLMIITNRTFWIPYVTAYDWMRFGDEILNSKLTLGRSIGIYAWLIGEPKMEIEKMVYEYEFGVPEGGAGASNTVFLVDAKLAFGWIGVIFYCVVFVFCSAVIFSSRNVVVKFASVTSFFTATVSPLTATLLSGGLIFLMLISLLYEHDGVESDVNNE